MFYNIKFIIIHVKFMMNESCEPCKKLWKIVSVQTLTILIQMCVSFQLSQEASTVDQREPTVQDPKKK